MPPQIAKPFKPNATLRCGFKAMIEPVKDPSRFKFKGIVETPEGMKIDYWMQGGRWLTSLYPHPLDIIEGPN